MTLPRSRRSLTALLLVAPALLLAGCGTANQANGPAVTGSIGQSPVSAQPRSITPQQDGPRAQQQATSAPLPKNSALVEQTTRLAEAFRRNPGNAAIALPYIYNLRMLGMQDQSILALGEAYRANPDDPKIASEYGRLMVGTGKDEQAKRVLERAATNQDWRALSALGTVEARAGNYAKATEFFRQANQIEPNRASIINNLGLALALDGKPAEAENLLRNADDSGHFGPRLRQNLALVLALQGKYDEAQSMATTDLPPKEAAANIAYLKRMTGTGDIANGVQFTDETIPPARTAAKPAPRDQAPATTASVPAAKTAAAKPVPAKSTGAAKPAARAPAAPDDGSLPTDEEMAAAIAADEADAAAEKAAAEKAERAAAAEARKLAATAAAAPQPLFIDKGATMTPSMVSPQSR